MSRAYKFVDPSQAYFVSFATVNWIDVFTRKEYCEIVVESLRYCQENKGLVLYGWCIMPSHLHLIMATEAEPLEDILRDFKKYTSTQLLKAITAHPGESRKEWMLWMFERAGKRNPNNTRYQFWQQNNQPISLFSAIVFEQKLTYLHQNPVAASFVNKAEDWHWSSARNYADPAVIGPLALQFAR